MKKIVKKFAFASLLFTSWASGNSIAQDAPKTSSIFTIEETELEKEKNRYTKTFDSLLLEERYRNIIELGEVLSLDREPGLAQIPSPYLICAYYFIGNKERSKELLNKKINKLDYKDLVELLTSSDIPFIKYFSVPENRDLIITKAIQDYKKNEKATNKAAGEQLIRFSINDQLYRKQKYLYKEDDTINQGKIFKEFKLQDSIQNAQVLAFYKKHKKYFSVKEVGERVSWYQPIILCHYDNIEQRQTFFKDLLERAVKEDRLGKTSYVHFLLRTESFTDPDFFKNLEKRMAEVRKEFDLPDYLWNPF
jgi:hypothetical protein